MRRRELQPVCSTATIGGLHSADGASSSTPSAPAIGLLRRNEPLSHQVRDPHDCDRIAYVGRLLFGVLVAGPDEILFGCERLPILIELKLPFGDMADHGILHRRTHGLRSRLHDDVFSTNT